jgi:hypothetical protein
MTNLDISGVNRPNGQNGRVWHRGTIALPAGHVFRGPALSDIPS